MLLKAIKKLWRIMKHSRELIKLIWRQDTVKKYVSIRPLNCSERKKIFNVSIKTNADGSMIAYGRKIFYSKSSFQHEPVYRGIVDDSDMITFLELDDTILKLQIPNYLRLEDIRPIKTNDGELAIAVLVLLGEDKKTYRLFCKQIILNIFDNKIENYIIYDTHNQFEKNWVQICDMNKFCYSLQPLQIISLNFDAFGSVPIKTEIIASLRYRNSTNFCKYKGYFYAVGHKVLDLGLRNVYVHFYIKICITDSLAYVSKDFFFNELSSEFALSAEVHDRNFVVAFSNHYKGNFLSDISLQNLSDLSWSKI